MCKNCKESFKPRRRTQVYCSASCHHSRGSYSETRECAREGCTNNFTVPGKAYPKVYCSSSCAAVVNNSLHPKRIPVAHENTCNECGVPVDYERSYCDSHKYGHSFRRNKKIALWLAGEWDGAKASGDLSVVVRSYLLDQASHSCTECGFNTPHPDGSSILQVDHIDGNGSNHSPDNLRVLCPNCHALTDTYGARNYGNGRAYRREQYRRKGTVD